MGRIIAPSTRIYDPSREKPPFEFTQRYGLDRRGAPVSVDGLVAYYLMNEGGGNTVADLSGNGNRGGFVADTHWVGGNTGQALSLDGTADYILLDRCASPASLPVTVIIKAKIGSVAAFQRLFHSCLSTGNTDLEGIYIQTAPGGKLEIGFGSGGMAGAASRRTKISATSVTTNWETYAGVIRGATDMSLYINGVDAGGTYDGIGDAYDPGSSPGGIGVFEYKTNLYYLTGLVEYVYLFNRALSASEISLLYREPFCQLAQPRLMVNVPVAVGGSSVAKIMQQHNQFNGGQAA